MSHIVQHGAEGPLDFLILDIERGLEVARFARNTESFVKHGGDPGRLEALSTKAVVVRERVQICPRPLLDHRPPQTTVIARRQRRLLVFVRASQIQHVLQAVPVLAEPVQLGYAQVRRRPSHVREETRRQQALIRAQQRRYRLKYDRGFVVRHTFTFHNFH